MVFRGNETPYRVCCSCYFDYKKESACFCHSSNLVPSNSSNSTEPLTKDDFQLLRVIGRGSVVARNQVEHTKSERKILEEIDHPFLCRLEFAFQTEDKLYLGMQFMAGGPLFYHLQHVFSNDSSYLSVVISQKIELVSMWLR